MTEEKLFKWLQAEIEAEEKGEHEFICPLCGGNAWWRRSIINNHKWSKCNDCGFTLGE